MKDSEHRLGSEEATALLGELIRALQGRYVLGDVLGAGRGGIVVRARHTASGRDVAVKVAWNTPAARARVLRETLLTRNVAHPNALAAVRVDAPEPMVIVVMPLASGGTLGDLLDAGEPVPYDRVLQILRRVARALDHAHAAGILHGGLQPEKILINDNDEAVISDFGLRMPAPPQLPPPPPPPQ